MKTPALMLLGTHSNAGKSLIATAFCRMLLRRGINVAPFKAQNMSNNAGVTPEGGEMGRAQIVQAAAAGILPHTDMNPVLLKPEANRRSQIVLNGKANGHIEAKNWFEIKRMLWTDVQNAYDRLAARHDVIIMEGAGSPAEINLKAGDIVNLRMARYADASCLLIGDIDRGGVFAALAGTLLLLEPDERAQIHGFIINKFRGDPALLGNALDVLQKKAFGVPTLGVVPFVPDLQIADEDAVALDNLSENGGLSTPASKMDVDIAVIHLPHIANFDEFAPLAAEPGVQVRYVQRVEDLRQPHAIIIPGSKVTLADLAWMREAGLDEAILARSHEGVTTIGICGGYQILGQHLADPMGVEGPAGDQASGLGLLPVATEFCAVKQTHQAQLCVHDGQLVRGYEIHTGNTELFDGAKPFGKIISRGRESMSLPDGAIRSDGKVWGTYLHGIFENQDFRRQWLWTHGWSQSENASIVSEEIEYDRLADAVEEALAWSHIEAMLAL